MIGKKEEKEIQSKLEGGVDKKGISPVRSNPPQADAAPSVRTSNGVSQESKKGGRRFSVSREKWREISEKAKLAEERFDRLLRLQAEFENYRKRINKERSEFIQYAIEDLICDLLPVIDNFQRAIESAREHDNSRALLQGVEMVHKQVQDVLAKRGLERIETLGRQFDPREHEAVMQVESEERPDNIVIEENLAGYKLKNKVIRPAIVKVSKKKAQSDEGVKG